MIAISKESTVILPQTQQILNQTGEQIRLARLRRHLSAKLVAERAGISRVPLRNIKKGGPSVAIGSYATVLHALHGMDKDLLLIASILLTRILLVSLRTPHRTGGGAC